MAGTQATFTGCLYESNGIWQMRAYYLEGCKRKTKNKSTKLPIKGNKKKAQAMLNDWLEELNADKPSFAETGFYEYLMEWLESYKHSIETISYVGYKDIIQEYLGHGDISTTANIYSHLLFQSKRNMADRMGSLLRTS